jgi:hypothetical protein
VEVLGKTMKILTASVLTEDLPNAKLESCRHTDMLGRHFVINTEERGAESSA